MKANGLKMVSIRLVDDPPIYSEDKIQNPNDAVQLLLKEFDSVDRELFFVLNLKSQWAMCQRKYSQHGDTK